MSELWDSIDKRTANVYGIYGNLGGGKTLSAVEIMICALNAGFPVTTNVQLRHIEGAKGKYTFIDDFSVVDFWKLPTGAPRGSSSSFRSFIVIDECAEFFDQYSSTSPVVKSFLSWLRHSSKRGQFVFLIVQKPEFLAKSLRLLVNKWIVCTDMEQMRLPIFRIKVPFMSDFVMRRIFDRVGNLISRGFMLCDKGMIGRYYDTSQSIATEGREFDAVPVDEPPPLPSALWVLVWLYVLFCFWMM